MNQIPLVVGGDINNNIIIFNSTTKANSINFNIDTICDILVVGGGGGGGGANGGGGGGGSVINKTITFKKGIYIIEIGSGGTGGQYADQNNIYGSSGLNGKTSHIYGNGIDIYAAGGGGGGSGFINDTAQNGSEAGSLHYNNYSSGGGGGSGKFNNNSFRGISLNNFSGNGANGTSLTSGGGGGAVGNASGGNGGSGYVIPNNSTKFNNITRFAGGGAGSSGVAVDGGGDFNINGTLGGGGGGGSSNGANGGDGVIMIIFYNKIYSGTNLSIPSSGTLTKTLSSTITSSAIIPNSASSTLTQDASSSILIDNTIIYSSNLSNYDNIINNNASLLNDIYTNYVNSDNLYIFNKDTTNDLIENYINNSLYLTNNYNNQISFNDYSYLINVIGNIYESIYNMIINIKNKDDLAFNKLINNIKEIHITNNKTEIINNSIINLNSTDINDNKYLLLQLSSDDLNINKMVFKQLEPAEYPPIKYSEKKNNNTYYTITIANTCYGIGDYNIYSSSENDPSLLFDNNYSQDFSFNNNTYNPEGYFIPSDTKNNYLVDKNYEGEWFVIELPQFIVVDGYYIINSKNFPNNAPSIFRVYGSTNGIKWDLIDDCTTSVVYSNNKYQKILTTETILYKYICFTFSQVSNKNSGTLKINQIKILGRQLEINKIGSLADYNLTYKKSQIKIIDQDYTDDTNSQNKFLNNNLYNIFNFNSTDFIMNLYYYKFFYKIIKYQNTLTKILYYNPPDLNSDQIDINSRGLNIDIYNIFDSKNYLSTIETGSPYTNGVNIIDFSSLSAATNGAINNNDNITFTCKWSGYIYIPKSYGGDYNFKLNMVGFGNIWISDKEINIPDINDKKIADNTDNFTIKLDADKFYSIVIIYGHLNISKNAYLNLNITGPYTNNQSDLFYNQTIDTSSYYDNNTINSTLTSLNNDVAELVKSNDISNYILYKQQSDYINTIIDIKSIET